MHNLDHSNNQEASLMTVLRQLLAHVNLSANALAKALNLPPPTINRLLTGDVKDPRVSTLIAIADYFDIQVDQLLGRQVLNGKFATDTQAPPLIVRPPLSIPVLTLNEAIDHEQNYKSANQFFRWQKQVKANDQDNHSSIFAITIKNNLYEPIFNVGTTLIVDPHSKLDSGDYLLVHFAGDSTTVIKKYIAEGHDKYLYSLKPDLKPITLAENDCRIVGAIIEGYISFKN